MRQKYSTDLTDKHWEEIQPLLVGMRNRKWSKRDLIDAVFYLVDSGCKWRQFRICIFTQAFTNTFSKCLALFPLFSVH